MIWLFYTLQILIAIATVTIIMIQKSSDGLFTSSKAFGIRGRSNGIIKITYILGALFLINSMMLGIFYQREHKKNLIKESTEQTVQKTANITEQETKLRDKE